MKPSQNQPCNPHWVSTMLLIGIIVFILPAYVGAAQTITLHQGQQKSLKFSTRIARLALGNPEVIDVKTISSREVLLTPKKTGISTFHIWLKGSNQAKEYKVEITAPEDILESVSSTGLHITSAGKDLLVTGTTDTVEKHGRALEIARSTGKTKLVDTSSMSFRYQVQADIKIVEISRTKLKNAGFFLSRNTANTTASLSPPGTLSSVEGGIGSGFSLQSDSGFLPRFNAFNIVSGNSNKGILGVLSLLEGNGFAYTLAEPSLVALSGQTASFHVGGEFPIPIRQGSGSDSSISIEYKEFGIKLSLAPTILSEDKIMLRVAPEVSELDFTAGVESGGVSVPALRVRRTETSVELGNGESFVIAGLVSKHTAASVDRVPGLGKLPVIGAFFRSSNLDASDRELIMVVTPHLVSPMKAGADMPDLPGESFRHYDPSYSRFLFMEDGSFGRKPDNDYGFSK